MCSLDEGSVKCTKAAKHASIVTVSVCNDIAAEYGQRRRGFGRLLAGSGGHKVVDARIGVGNALCIPLRLHWDRARQSLSCLKPQSIV